MLLSLWNSLLYYFGMERGPILQYVLLTLGT